MPSNQTLVEMLNAIRAAGSDTYRDRVPLATLENLVNVGNPLMTYAATANEFLSALVNRIGLVIVRNRELHNPLSILKQGEMPLGKDIEEIFTNPAIATPYNPTSTNLLAQTPPDTKAIYHRMNRQDKYTVTVNNEQLRKAFASWEELSKLIDSIVNSLYGGNYYDEFILCKSLLGDAVATGKCLTDTVTAVTDAASAKAFITAARARFTNFGFPSSANNAYSAQTGATGQPVITWTPPEDVRFILRSDVSSICDVEVLANAFNMDKTAFLGQTLLVDDFGTAENCLAIMCDKAFPQIYDNLREMREFGNGENLTWNYYLHVWQTYSVSLFCNAVAFCTT